MVSQDRDPQRPSTELLDPLSYFRHFIDSQFDRLATGIHAIPDIMSDMRSRVEPHHKSSYETASPMIWLSQARRPCPYSPAEPSKEAQQAVKLLLAQSQKRNSIIDRRLMSRLFTDLGDDSTRRGSSRSRDPCWLGVDWFESSPYSPAQIEVHQHTHQQGSMWRAAFEDLLCAELGKPLSAHAAWSNQRADQALYSAWAQEPRDWMLGLSCRGVLPPHLPNLYRYNFESQDHMLKNIVTADYQRPRVPTPVLCDLLKLADAVSTFDRDEIDEQTANSPGSEQDLYEAFLGQSAAQAKRPQVCPVVQHREQIASSQCTKPTVLSTLTTTERTTLPDGTVTTKVIVKKSFSDGRQESSETVSTTQSGLSPVSIAERDTDKRAKTPTGWFWS